MLSEAVCSVLRDHAGMTYAWGRHDCVALVRDYVIAAKGFDPFAHVDQWTSEQEAFAIHGGQLERAFEQTAQMHGWLELPRLQAALGDLATCDVPISKEDCALGIVCGPGIAVAARHGFIYVPLYRTRRAWRLG